MSQPENVEGVSVGWDEEQIHIDFLDLFGDVLGAYAFRPDEAAILVDCLNVALERHKMRYGRSNT